MAVLGSTTPVKVFTPGTTGWSVVDLESPVIESKWVDGRYEIIEGVLTLMPPAYFSGGEAAFNLVFLLETHLRASGLKGGGFSPEADLVMSPTRVVRADFAYLTRQQREAQRQAVGDGGRTDPRRSRLLVPPTLIIESVSPGHETHDLKIKRSWYAEFGVANYWILNVFEESLDCLILQGDDYVTDCAGYQADVLKPSLFPGLQLRLADVWPER